MYRRMVIWAVAVTLFFLRHILPVIIRGAITGILLMFTSLIGLWRGVRPTVDEMAEEWTDRVMRMFHHTRYRLQLYRFFQGVAWLSLVAGWVLSALVTVWMVRWIF